MILDLNRAVSTLDGRPRGAWPRGQSARDRPSYAILEGFSGRVKVFGHTQAQGSPFDSGIRPLCIWTDCGACWHYGGPCCPFACPPASDSGIRGYTGRARALLPSSSMLGRAPARLQDHGLPGQAVRPSPASLQSLIPRGVRGASPRLNLTLLQHRFTGVEGKDE